MNQNEMMRKALRKAYLLGQKYWQQADSEYISQQRKSNETHQEYMDLVEETLKVLSSEPAKLVRLTDEEIDAAFSEADKNCMNDRRFAIHFANAIMDAIETKNGRES